MGASLRQCDTAPADRFCPYLFNEECDCFELDAAFPEFCAVGARALLPRMKNRLSFEVCSEPTAFRHIAQVGLARIDGEPSRIRSGRLDSSTLLQESFIYNSAGDLSSSTGEIEIMAPGNVPGLNFRLENWCSGAPCWLTAGKSRSLIMMEVDLRQGRIAISLDEWAADPLVLGIPALIEEDAGQKQWLPFISLTAVGQSARIVDFHACIQA